MNKEQIKSFLKKKPGYLDWGAERLSERLDCSVETCKHALREARADARDEDLTVDNVSDNSITEFQAYLKEQGIDESDVKSVKFWQTMKGDPRFSIVTKGGTDEVSEISKVKEEILDILYKKSPRVERRESVAGNDPVMYEVSLPDIHYGKIDGRTIEQAEKEYMDTIHDLMQKGQGLEIEKICLPIGNDGMNSEGYSRATTKGTPQHDSAEWQQTFVGYCALTVRAIEYLSQYAPVEVVVIQGNHDYERMFYAGEYLKAYFLQNGNISVDNDFDSRKYVEYGTNMILFTHGDKEKAPELPLIMATEQPEMFARCTHREAHCGHKHKEQVNEYRGIKVRFIPSICANDAWHKMMGYEAKRTAQAHVWNKKRGYEGYLQTNL